MTGTRGVYYNEIDPYPAQWLRNLIEAGHIPEGDVDERSIADVQPSDVVGYRQCHFFAGIGGWPLALRWAGAEDIDNLWTGSCPCQPLSVAGQQKGHADERHLWPAFYSLIAERKPAIVFGEQVAGKNGREWLAGVRADLEASGYALGAADLCAAGVGASHIRQRIYWLADANGERWNAVGVQVRCHREGSVKSSTSFASERTSNVVDRFGRRRKIKSGVSLVVDGVPGQMEQIRAYGNAIVPQVAEQFIRAAL